MFCLKCGRQYDDIYPSCPFCGNPSAVGIQQPINADPLPEKPMSVDGRAPLPAFNVTPVRAPESKNEPDSRAPLPSFNNSAPFVQFPLPDNNVVSAQAPCALSDNNAPVAKPPLPEFNTMPVSRQNAPEVISKPTAPLFQNEAETVLPAAKPPVFSAAPVSLAQVQTELAANPFNSVAYNPNSADAELDEEDKKQLRDLEEFEGDAKTVFIISLVAAISSLVGVGLIVAVIASLKKRSITNSGFDFKNPSLDERYRSANKKLKTAKTLRTVAYVVGVAAILLIAAYIFINILITLVYGLGSYAISEITGGFLDSLFDNLFDNLFDKIAEIFQ